MPDISKQPTTPDLPAGFSRRFLLEEAMAIDELGTLRHIAQHYGWTHVVLRNVLNLEPELAGTKPRFGVRPTPDASMVVDVLGFRLRSDPTVAFDNELIVVNERTNNLGFSDAERTALGRVAVRQLPVDAIIPPHDDELENLDANMALVTASAGMPLAATGY